jgi:hypothetical protein
MTPSIEDIRNDRQFKALTGMSRKEFEPFLPTFAEASTELRQEADDVQRGPRQRKPGGGPKGKLVTMAQKLLFILYYWKVYPGYDVLGFQFGLDGSKACTNVHALWPVLKRALANGKVLPHREFARVEELRDAFADIAELFIDATERPHVRPQDDEEQRQKFSGNKKRHTVKNTVITTASSWILFFGLTVAGSVHDDGRFKEEFPLPEGAGKEELAAWFEDVVLWLDLGYQGIQKAYAAKTINLPHKKPRKSTANPHPSLTEEQKAENQAISRIRVVVEQAIGGLKRLGILVQRFRNHPADFVDEVGIIGAGLWNWTLKCKGISYYATTLLFLTRVVSLPSVFQSSSPP